MNTLKVYTYGTTKLFCEVAFEIGREQNLLGGSVHVDTSTFSLSSAYEEEEGTTSPPDSKGNTSSPPSDQAPVLEARPIPRHGYSKDHRPDLKQMVINLATTGSSGFPIWMEAHSGNAADSKIIYEAAQRMKAFCNSIDESPDFLVVGDSAIYDSCTKSGGDTLFLTRVPERHKAVKDLVQLSDQSFAWSELDGGYKVCVTETKYRGVHQRWAVIFSQQAHTREMKTLNKRIEKDKEGKCKELWHLGNQTFDCQKDAKKALDEFQKTVEKGYHCLSANIIPIMRHKGRGRPTKDVQPSISGYQIEGELTRNEDKIEATSNGKGRFILATNQLDREALPDRDILSEYKEQSTGLANAAAMPI